MEAQGPANPKPTPIIMRNQESNPYVQRLDQIQAAKVKWAASEWLLSFLRTEGSEKPKEPTDEQLLEWARL